MDQTELRFELIRSANNTLQTIKYCYNLTFIYYLFTYNYKLTQLKNYFYIRTN